MTNDNHGKCDQCGSEEKLFTIPGDNGNYCSLCQQEIESDYMEQNGSMAWQDY